MLKQWQFLANFVSTVQDGVRQIEVSQMADVIAAGAILVDVREQYEWDEDRIPGALLRPMSLLEQWQDEFAGKELLLQCRSGRRSHVIAYHLQSKGEVAHNLAGGILAYRQQFPTD